MPTRFGKGYEGGTCLGHAGRLTRDRLARLKEAVESIACWGRPDESDEDRRVALRVDESGAGQIAEAWVPVLTPDGAAILTRTNCG